MQILRLATVLPKRCYPTERLLEAFPCTLPEGVRQNVLNLGVARRYFIEQPQAASAAEIVLGEDGLLNLCSDACDKVIKEASLSIEDIDYLVATYDVNPFLSPGLSQLLIPKLGLDP